MDAAGIDALLVDEFVRFDEQWNHHPGYVGPSGVWRNTTPYSERAFALHPDRFRYVARIGHLDPAVDELMAAVREQPGAVCIRIVPHPRTTEVEQFQAGAYASLFEAAEKYDVPVMCWLPGRGTQLVQYLERFPSARVVLDHTGVSDTPLGWHAGRETELHAIAELARFPNLHLKWSRAPERLSAQEYPFADALPLLRIALDAFGPERVLWASDYTQSRVRHSWAAAYHYLLDSDQLSSQEKEWLLGKSARRLLAWPASAAQPASSAAI
jgi:predicted TIM-barrel fold metal-dependent hydrolase